MVKNYRSLESKNLLGEIERINLLPIRITDITLLSLSHDQTITITITITITDITLSQTPL